VSVIVLDASGLVAATTRTDGYSVSLRKRIAAVDCHAPHLIDAELGSVLRRMTLRGQPAPRAGGDTAARVARLLTHRHDHGGSLAEAADHRRRAARIGTAPALHHRGGRLTAVLSGISDARPRSSATASRCR